MVNIPKPNAQPTKLDETIDVSQLSETSVSLIEHFGLDAPEKLNAYSCALEDALVDLLELIKVQQQTIKQLESRLTEFE